MVMVLTILRTLVYGCWDMAKPTTDGYTRAYGLGRNKFLQIRVTEKEHEQLTREARRRGYSTTSDFLRAVGLDATPESATARKNELKALDQLESDVQALASTIRTRHSIGGGK